MSLPLSADDAFLPVLQKILDGPLATGELQPDGPDDIVNPLTFYDRHVASNLLLKSIRIVPSLHETLSTKFKDSLAQFVTKGHKFPTTNYPQYGDGRTTPVHFGYSVGTQYSYAAGTDLAELAAKIFIYPDIPEWYPVLIFVPGDYERPSVKSFAVEGRVVPNFYSTPSPEEYRMKELLERLPAHRRTILRDMPKLYAWLASWTFFSYTPKGHSLVARMPAMSHFGWQGPQTEGLSTYSRLPTPPDAQKGLSFTVVKSQRTRKRPSDSTPSKVASSDSAGVKIKIPARKSKGNCKPTSRDFIQKAWISAIKEDCTFLIFNCGRYERIGIRHRESQTLYLSSLLDGSSPVNYGHIHAGLYLAIIEDVYARHHARKQFHSKWTNTLKRSASQFEDNSSRRKRSKMTNTSDPPTYRLSNSDDSYKVNEVEKAFATRSVLLLSLKYDIYDSPSPSSFVRIGSSCVKGLFDSEFKPMSSRKRVFKPEEYVSLALGPPIGSGAVGTAHAAALELRAQNGKILPHSCIVKLAFDKKARESIQNEFNAYRHLATRGMFEGIVRVHGLFEDVVTGTLALVMDNGGRSLRHLENAKDENYRFGYVFVEKEKQDIYLSALERIHSAGICHNDIRLENLLVNEANEISIIDFDSATYDLRMAPEDIETLKTTIMYVPPESTDDTGSREDSDNPDGETDPS